MVDKIRWGIIGTGHIAHQFATGLQVVNDAELVAIGSRTQASADKFGDEFAASHRHASYEALAADPDVDAVYIGTLHPMHKDNTLRCLEAGKAVLCEKPFAINAAESQAMIDLARQRRIFLMEAMWTRHFPIMVRLRELLAQEVIGEVRQMNVDFGFRNRFNAQSRWFNPDLGGGALLDVGIYPITLAYMVLGRPQRIVSAADLGRTGVDENAAMIFSYASGALASLQCALQTETPQVAIINGTKGRITIHSQWWKPERMTVEVYGGAPTEIHLPMTGNGYNYEAVEVGRCLREGLLESEVIPLDESLAIMRSLDEIRAQWGLKYPME